MLRSNICEPRVKVEHKGNVKNKNKHERNSVYAIHNRPM